MSFEENGNVTTAEEARKKPAPHGEEDVFAAAELDDAVADAAASRAARERMIARLRLLWEQRRFLVRTTLLGLLAAVLIAFLLPKRYEATARLMPPESQSGSGLAMLAAMSGTGGLGAVAGNVLGVKSTGAVFVGVLQSRTVQDRLVESFGLQEVYGAGRLEDARRQLAGSTGVSEDRKSGIVTITVTDKDPQRAAALAGAYVAELDRLVVELTTSAASRERAFLEERLAKVKEDLDAAAKTFSEFASKNAAIDIREQGRAMVEAAATLQGQLIVAETELEGLRQVYTDNNVRVKAVRARIAELKKQLEKLGGPATAAPGAERAEGSPYPTIRELPLLGVTYADLYRQTKIQETVFELLTQQHELAKVQEVKGIPTVKVLDAPVVPERKSFPPRLLIMALGTFFSLGLAMVWVLGRARWEATDAADPGKALAQEVFSTIGAQRFRFAGNGYRLRELPKRLWNLRARTNGSVGGSPPAGEPAEESKRAAAGKGND